MTITASRQVIPEISEIKDAVLSGQSFDCKLHALLSAFHKAVMLGRKGGDLEQGFQDFLTEIVK